MLISIFPLSRRERVANRQCKSSACSTAESRGIAGTLSCGCYRFNADIFHSIVGLFELFVWTACRAASAPNQNLRLEDGALLNSEVR